VEEAARVSTEPGRAVPGEALYDAAMFRVCEQCGCCSSACPMTGVDDFNIRRILRHLEFGLEHEVVNSPMPWMCAACGRCEEACPNGIGILDIVRALRLASPDQWIPEGPPCVLACPVQIDIPGYAKLIADGNIDEAYALIREKVPFPGILGRVCTRPCEAACRRGDVFDQPIAICALKRYVADTRGHLPEQLSRVEKDTGRKIAIVGAGPAGLTAAFYLRKKGHQVTVFEERPEPGGMMRFGIPDYRLPQEVVEREIAQVLAVGIELQTGKKLGRDFHLDQLKAEGYEVVFLAIGAQLSRRIDLEGADLDDVMWGVDFLYEVNEGKEVTLKDKVLVVGGGNVAIDVALTALRLGAKEVTLACLEARDEMPANRWEIEEALEEGVILMPSWGPKRIIGEKGRVSGTELVQCTCVFDEEGNFCPAFGTETATVNADQVILAIGQAPDFSCIGNGKPLSVEQGSLEVDHETQGTEIPWVFAGGDMVRVPGTIVDAIAAGRRAASAIDKFLGGDGMIDETLVERSSAESSTGKREPGFADLKRATMPTMPVSERHTGFSEVEQGFDEELAVHEAKRCLRCDLELCLAQEGKERESA
jgi:NADPH-dependent glutamate synthase beta subunit-like oxidoreductase